MYFFMTVMSLLPNYDATDLFCFYNDLHDV